MIRYKTFKEFADTCLPPPVRKRFYENMLVETYQKGIDSLPDTDVYSHEEVADDLEMCVHLDKAFYWGSSPEGDWYWRSMAKRMINYEYSVED